MQFELTEEIRKRPFIRLTIPFIVGILIAIFTNFTTLIYTLVLIASLVCFLFLNYKNNFTKNRFVGLLMGIILISTGALLTSVNLEKSHNTKLTNYKGFIIGEICKDPKSTEKTIVLNIEIKAIKNNTEWISTAGKTLLYLEKNTKAESLIIGDKIVFSPELSEVENKGNPEEFDYKQYLAYNLVYNSDYLEGDDWELLDSDGVINIRYNFLRFRQDLIAKLQDAGLKDEELGVISALALGYKDNLSDEIRHSYASSGAMHILAVSGLHVGIIYGMLIFILSFIKSKKLQWLKTVIIISFIWFYAILTGLSPSVSRAALMFTLIAIGKLQNKGSDSLNAIAASAFILLVINPMNIMNIGFQLSYIAVIGIILLYPKIYSLLNPKNKILDKIWSLTAVSVAAQIATAPLGVYYFHQFSNLFLISNYLLIPLSTLAIWLCILFFMFSGIGFLAGILSNALFYIIRIMNTLSGTIESLPLSVSENLYVSIPQLILIYIAIIFISVFLFNSKKYKHLIIGIISIIIVSVFNLFYSIETKNQEYIIVYNINKTTAINIIDGKDNILFANIDSCINENIEYTAKNNWLKKGLSEEEYIDLSSDRESILSNLSNIDNRSIFFKRNFIGFNDKKIAVIDNDFTPIFGENYTKPKVDFIILAQDTYLSLSEVNEMFNFSEIIIDGSNSFYRVDEWLVENDSLQLKIHNVRTDGAFIYEF